MRNSETFQIEITQGAPLPVRRWRQICLELNEYQQVFGSDAPFVGEEYDDDKIAFMRVVMDREPMLTLSRQAPEGTVTRASLNKDQASMLASVFGRHCPEAFQVDLSNLPSESEKPPSKAVNPPEAIMSFLKTWLEAKPAELQAEIKRCDRFQRLGKDRDPETNDDLGTKLRILRDLADPEKRAKITARFQELSPLADAPAARPSQEKPVSTVPAQKTGPQTPDPGKGLFVLQKGGFSFGGWDKALNAILFAEQEPTLRYENRDGQTTIAFFDRKTDKEVFVLSRSLGKNEPVRLSDLTALSAEQKQYFYDLVNHLKLNAGVDMSTSILRPSVNLVVVAAPNPTPGVRVTPAENPLADAPAARPSQEKPQQKNADTPSNRMAQNNPQQNSQRRPEPDPIDTGVASPLGRGNIIDLGNRFAIPGYTNEKNTNEVYKFTNGKTFNLAEVLSIINSEKLDIEGPKFALRKGVKVPDPNKPGESRYSYKGQPVYEGEVRLTKQGLKIYIPEQSQSENNGQKLGQGAQQTGPTGVKCALGEISLTPNGKAYTFSNSKITVYQEKRGYYFTPEDVAELVDKTRKGIDNDVPIEEVDLLVIECEDRGKVQPMRVTVDFNNGSTRLHPPLAQSRGQGQQNRAPQQQPQRAEAPAHDITDPGAEAFGGGEENDGEEFEEAASEQAAPARSGGRGRR